MSSTQVALERVGISPHAMELLRAALAGDMFQDPSDPPASLMEDMLRGEVDADD